MKHLIILMFLGCCVNSYCSAQALPTDTIIKTSSAPREAKFAVTFISSDTCNLRINGIDYGEIVKNKAKTIAIPLGNYKFLFESLETGEAIKKRSFRFTRDSLQDGKYTYQVIFKRQN